MHVQIHFEEKRLELLHGLIRAHPLATFVTTRDGELVVNHMPFYLETSAKTDGVLMGHLPRANTIWQAFDGNHKAVVIFQGPEAYISPSWYASKREHGKVVPTWNFVVVHAHGCPRAVHDGDWLLAHLNQLVDAQEGGLPAPWQVSDAPHDYIAQQMRGIVGIEMPIARLDGKWKVSQNKSDADRDGVIAALKAQGDDASLAMAALLEKGPGAR